MTKLFANSGDPDQTPRSAASDLGLHCLPINLLGVARLQWDKRTANALIDQADAQGDQDVPSYNFDPLKPHFYIVKLGFTGVYIIFLIFAQKHRLWVLVKTASPRRF